MADPQIHYDWLPPYRIREDVRAGRVILRMTPGLGLQITVPRGFDQALLAEVFDRHRDWIQRHAVVVGERDPKALLQGPPAAVELKAVRETWSLTTAHRPNQPLTLHWNSAPPPHLELTGDCNRTSAWHRLLQEWLKVQGRRLLPPWVDGISRETGFRVSRICVRLQRSRWGSYSNRGSLSLNAALLLLPRVLVRHVILHELCHTVHPNHSPEFHRELARWAPNYRQHEAQLKSAAESLPQWARG